MVQVGTEKIRVNPPMVRDALLETTIESLGKILVLLLRRSQMLAHGGEYPSLPLLLQNCRRGNAANRFGRFEALVQRPGTPCFQ
jgi:hypothetical protein